MENFSGAAPGPTLPPATVRRIVETALYVDSLEESETFYVRVLGCRVMLSTDRLVALSVADTSVLLLFARGASDGAFDTPGGTVPGHGAHGPQHLAFAIDAAEVTAWRERLGAAGVDIESRVTWPRGGESLYFRDPSGHSIELITPGLWEIY